MKILRRKGDYANTHLPHKWHSQSRRRRRLGSEVTDLFPSDLLATPRKLYDSPYLPTCFFFVNNLEKWWMGFNKIFLGNLDMGQEIKFIIKFWWCSGFWRYFDLWSTKDLPIQILCHRYKSKYVGNLGEGFTIWIWIRMYIISNLMLKICASKCVMTQS